MTYTAKYHQLRAQRTYTRAIARRGLPALLEPYRMAAVSECGRITRDAIPSQRRRVVRAEVSA